MCIYIHNTLAGSKAVVSISRNPGRVHTHVYMYSRVPGDF